MKLITKKQIKEFIETKYGKYTTISDDELFDGKRMTMQCYQFLRSMFNKYTPIDDLGYHCYKHFIIPFSMEEQGYNDAREKIMRPEINKIIEHLEKIVKDGCYFISDSVAGGRDGSNDAGCNWYHAWQSPETEEFIDIWVFDESAAALEFANDNQTKFRFLFNLD